MTEIPYYLGAQDTNANEPKSFDWTSYLQRGETIVSYQVTCADTNLIIGATTLSGRSNNPAVLTAFISGGVNQTAYLVDYQITTSIGATYISHCLLNVDNGANDAV